MDEIFGATGTAIQYALGDSWVKLRGEELAKPAIGLVVLAVSSKPLSSWHFPANREFNREILSFGLSFAPGAAPHAAQSTVLIRSWRTIDA